MLGLLMCRIAPIITLFVWITRQIRHPVASMRPALGGVPIVGNLLHVLHHRIQHPLNVNLLLTSQREMIQPFLDPNVGKHRFHNFQSPLILPPPLQGVNLLHHLLTAALGCCLGFVDQNPQVLLFGRLLGQALRPEPAGLTVLFLRHIVPIRAMAHAMLASFETQKLAIRATISLCGLIIGEILVPKSFLLLLFLLRRVALLGGKARIPLAEIAIRNVVLQGINNY